MIEFTKMRKEFIMKKLLIGCFIGMTVTIIQALGQNFTNLDFEAAHDLPSSGGSVATTDALPGWTAFNGTNQLSLIAYNVSALFELVGSNSYAVDGNFSVFLGRGCSISQAGLVPSDAQSLYFEEYVPSLVVSDGNEFVVSIGGQELSFTRVSQVSQTTTPNTTYLWGADISAFAGQTATLTFSSSGAGGTLDDIQFSSSPIPEPSPAWLLFLGSGVLIHVRRNKKHSRQTPARPAFAA
jgi:hypothetical protein